MDWWIVAALLSPFFWALSNIVDKVAVDHTIETPSQFMFLLSQFYSVVFLLYLMFHRGEIALAPLAVLAGALLFVLYYLYAVVLADEDVTSVIAIHQAEPLFVLVLAIAIYQTVPALHELLGFGLILLGIFWFTSSRKHGLDPGQIALPLIRSRSAALLILSALVGAVSTILSDIVLIDITVLDLVGQSALGYGLAGLIMLGVSGYRRRALFPGRHGLLRKSLMITLTGALDLMGYVSFYIALFLSARPGIVAVVTSIHPIFVFGLTAGLGLLFPDLIREDNTGRRLTNKAIGCVIVIVGVIALS